MAVLITDVIDLIAIVQDLYLSSPAEMLFNIMHMALWKEIKLYSTYETVSKQ